MWDIKLKCIDTDKSGGYQREEESGGSKGNQIHGVEGDLTLAGGHTCNILMMQHKNIHLKHFVILLNNVNPIHLT